MQDAALVASPRTPHFAVVSEVERAAIVLRDSVVGILILVVVLIGVIATGCGPPF